MLLIFLIKAFPGFQPLPLGSVAARSILAGHLEKPTLFMFRQAQHESKREVFRGDEQQNWFLLYASRPRLNARLIASCSSS